MFIGHFALGFAAKRAAPRVSLAALFGAAQLADLLWPLLLALGLEHVRIAPGDTAFTPLQFVSYPYSHSLALLIVWGVAFGWLYSRSGRADRGIAVLLALLVVSHWVLDVATHRADMPLYPGGPTFGLGLWNSVPATVAIEAAMYAAGVAVYMRATRARDAVGRWAFVALVAILAIAYVGNISSVPPSVGLIIVASIIGGAATIVLSWWADRHRDIQM